MAVASSATWAHELDLLQDAILDGLRARLGDATPPARAVRGRPDPGAAERRSKTLRPSNDPPIEVPPEIESEAAAAASEIDDPELRELVARAARASLVKARSDREF